MGSQVLGSQYLLGGTQDSDMIPKWHLRIENEKIGLFGGRGSPCTAVEMPRKGGGKAAMDSCTLRAPEVLVVAEVEQRYRHLQQE